MSDGPMEREARMCLSEIPVFVLVNVPVVRCSTLCEER
jgi:hypothetical protein